MFVKKTVYVEKREGEHPNIIFPTPGFSEERLERQDSAAEMTRFVRGWTEK